MDTIGDLLVKIKNAQAAGHPSVETAFSKTKLAIVKLFEQEGFLARVEKVGFKNKEKIEIFLKYEQGEPAINDLKRISRPGQRIYAGSDEIKTIKRGAGLAIISTSRGLMTDKEARKKHLGGEILCQIQ